jgi:integrase
MMRRDTRVGASEIPRVEIVPLGIELRSQYRSAVPRRPLQFATLQAFLDAAGIALASDAEARGLSVLTLRWWEQSLRTFAGYLRLTHEDVRFLSGDVELQLAVIDGWLRWLRTERHVSHTTARTYFGALTAIGQRLERAYGMVNPFGLVMPPRAGRPRPRVLTREQAENLISTITHYRWRNALVRSRNLAIVGLMLYAGLRRGEVVRLKTGDVHAPAGWLLIRHGKGKDGGKPRTAYLPPQLREILALYLRNRDAAKPDRTHPQLLTMTAENRPVTAVAITRLFLRLSAILGFPVSPHMLRHTYATLLRQFGVADRVSMDLLGHESLAMLTRYSHVFEPEYEVESRKLRLEVDLPLGPA